MAYDKYADEREPRAGEELMALWYLCKIFEACRSKRGMLNRLLRWSRKLHAMLGVGFIRQDDSARLREIQRIMALPVSRIMDEGPDF